MIAGGPECRDDRRRRELFRQRDRINGVDFVEVLDGPVLCVHFFGEVPTGLSRANVVVHGGRRIRDIQVVGVKRQTSSDPDEDDCLHVTVNKVGDFSTYRLCLVDVPRIDPRYRCAEFGFRIDCPDGLDCAAEPDCATAPEPSPEISYLAKDYASFRQLILDRLAVTMPGWRERHEADVGIALVEVLAYVADHLSYHQDAVATEAYLNTARQRVSVRRHARLVDYVLHEGLNARAWVTVWTAADMPSVRAGDLYFVTGAAELTATSGRVLRADDLKGVSAGRYLVFEPVADSDEELRFRAAHSEIRFHTWGGDECRLEEGATSATLLDPQRALRLRPGDVLIFEEVRGAGTGKTTDADPAHRHAVRLTGVAEAHDDLLDVPVVGIEWSPADALPFALHLSVRLPAPDCKFVDDVSVARGNVVLVDHGARVIEQLGPVEGRTAVGECGCEGGVPDLTTTPVRFTAVLPAAPVTVAEDVDPTGPAIAVVQRDPRLGRPKISLAEKSGSPGVWTLQPDLLSSSAHAPHFVAELDDDGRAHLRFGDGELGMMPPAGTTFEATYRRGNGTVGNVGRDAITHLVLRSRSWDGAVVRPRNPLAASGGTAAEPTAQARLLAPHAFRTELKRAITAEDYAQIAGRRPGVQAAASELTWTGSWYEATVAVDALGADVAEQALLDEVADHLRAVRRVGHDLAVVPASPVPLDVEVRVCVGPQHARSEVKAAVLEVLGSGRVRGRAGMFHPDNLTFGTSVRLSRIVAAIQAVEGVSNVEVTRLRRLGHPDAGELEAGVLTVRDLEIAQLTGDPSMPENGRLTLVMGGGR